MSSPPHLPQAPSPSPLWAIPPPHPQLHIIHSAPGWDLLVPDPHTLLSVLQNPRLKSSDFLKSFPPPTTLTQFFWKSCKFFLTIPYTLKFQGLTVFSLNDWNNSILVCWPPSSAPESKWNTTSRPSKTQNVWPLLLNTVCPLLRNLTAFFLHFGKAQDVMWYATAHLAYFYPQMC